MATSAALTLHTIRAAQRRIRELVHQTPVLTSATLDADTGASLFAMELMPRISRAQSMDALSSQANIAGYRAVLLAATRRPGGALVYPNVSVGEVMSLAPVSFARFTR